ncbi:hypothetical protein K1T71_001171 [Dendrolimus kikuchii]|uniref:Uncharacterized protein n=1 Tax=Dendrolimus kikuchii TaxID=765133 RepID=A0ACC1DH08_9NEOP|nr:hypothetical protein K1T71_001171 [Dendrolimus kikuchii]
MSKTGATRYQKFLKSEKSKTKLKAKKDLPKGTNVTKTNFKVKKIVIKEQLKKHNTSEVLSTRKLNLNDLLSRLTHFNTQSRTSALEGLKEVITTHPAVLHQNLGQLILGVTPLVLNVEKIVRRESLKVLHMILDNVNMTKISPFFDIMSTYLRSAMTHIDNRIQEDSLLFLDILLLCTPEKVVQDFHKIVPNFLDMISKLRVDSKPGRTLTVNLGSQMTSVKWRVKVLHRLKDYLNKFIHYNNCKDQNRSADVILKHFDTGKLNYYPLINENYTSVCHLSCFSRKSQEDVKLDEVERFKEYIDTLMPLLLETWIEVHSNGIRDKIETVLNSDAASLLKHILEVISQIWNLVRHLDYKSPSSNIKMLFCQKYRKTFNQHFLTSFPYVTNIRSKKYDMNTSFEDVITDPTLVAENLEICHLFIMLNPNVNVKNQHKEIVSVLNYIQKTFEKNKHDEINDSIVKILHTIFSRDINNWTKAVTVIDKLFIKIVETYFNVSNKFKQKLFDVLCKVALNDKLSHFHNSDAYKQWLEKLPDILLEDNVSVQTVDIIHKFAIQSNETFNSVVKPKLKNIIENLPTIVISDAINDTNSYHKLFSLLYWIKIYDGDSLNVLEKQLMENVYKKDCGVIFDTLKLRTGGMF